MKNFKKYFAAFLAVMMMVSAVPFAAFAQEAEAVEMIAFDESEEGFLCAEDSNEAMFVLQSEYEEQEEIETLVSNKEQLRGKKVEIAFLIDASGSMSPYIAKVKENVTAMAQYFESAGVNLRMAVVRFGAFADGHRAQVLKINNSSWHTSTEQLVETLATIPADGGTETLSDAIGDMLHKDPFTNQTNIQWSSNAYKFAFVLTNDFDGGVEGIDYNDYGYERLDDTIPDLNNKRIPVSVVTNPYCFRSYNNLATETGGKLYDINASDYAQLLINYANEIMGVTLKPTKAIYVLPDYMGSELYANEGAGELYFAKNGNNADLVNVKDEFVNNADGSPVSGNVGVNASKDDYGTGDMYKKLVEKLDETFGADNGGVYDVKFFPYNWIGDLNDSLEELEDDIVKNGYEDVVFVTHGAGGLLASAYVAKSEENKHKVEKAVLIAAPLFGTYAPMSQIIQGTTENLLNPEVVPGGKGEIKWSQWVRAWSQNAPTAYQMLPSSEYLKLYPVRFEGLDFGLKNITDQDEFYEMLNDVKNVNSNLTNGNNRSHEYFRETVLDNNIVNAWSFESLKEIDVSLIAGFNYDTPTYFEYTEDSDGTKRLTDIVYTVNGDGVVTVASSVAAMKGKSLGFDVERFDVAHNDLVSKNSVLTTVCEKIANAGKSYGFASLASDEASLMSDEVGMSDRIKIHYECDNVITASVLNSDEEVVATATGDEYEGFENGLIYDNFSDDASVTDAAIYIPNEGYKVVFSCGNEEGTVLDFNSEYSTLNVDGWKDMSVSVEHNTTIENGIVSSLDGTDEIITEEALKEIPDSQATDRFTEWDLPDTVKMNIGDVKNVDVTGSEAADVMGELTWLCSDKSIVDINENGVITAKNFGKVIVSASNGDKVETVEVVVMNQATSVNFDNVSMAIGERVLIKPVFAPAGVTETDLDYEISKSGVIEIDEYGVIYGVGAGTVTVTGKTNYGVKNTFTVSVEDDTNYAVESISINPETIKVKKGKTAKFTVDFTPANASNKEVEWFVDDETIASVENDAGVFTVTGLEEGTTVVSVVSVDGGYTAEAEITVTNKSTGGGGAVKPRYTINFETNGGTEVGSQSLFAGEKVEEPEDPELEGYTFAGWYRDDYFEDEYDFDFKIKHGFTLYAKWEAEETHKIILTIGDTEAVVFGEEVENDVAPMIKNSRTMLPIRFIAEALGASVRWNEPERKVLVIKGDIEIEIYIDSDVAYVNGEEVELDSPAFIENSRTFLPLRFVSENLGASVEWDDATRTVTITK